MAKCLQHPAPVSIPAQGHTLALNINAAPQHLQHRRDASAMVRDAPQDATMGQKRASSGLGWIMRRCTPQRPFQCTLEATCLAVWALRAKHTPRPIGRLHQQSSVYALPCKARPKHECKYTRPDHLCCKNPVAQKCHSHWPMCAPAHLRLSNTNFADTTNNLVRRNARSDSLLKGGRHTT